MSGVALKSGDGFGVPAESYEFANKRLAWETIPPLLDRASPLRSAHLRDPVGPQIHFASESFMDELAAALNLRSRRVPPAAYEGAARHCSDQSRRGESRLADAAVAAHGSDRQQGQRPRHRLRTAQWHARRGRGRGRYRPSTGKIWARKFTVAHDCGQIINPDGLRHSYRGQHRSGRSRTLWEEVSSTART